MSKNRTPQSIWTYLVVSLLVFLTVACSPQQQGSTNASPAVPANALQILAGSELADMTPILQSFTAKTGIPVNMVSTGTLSAVDTLLDPHTVDAVWVSHAKYLKQVPGVRDQLANSEKTMFSPVILGVKPEKAAELGWKSTVSWKDVLAAVSAKKLHLAMTTPTGSNTGFVTLVGLASELSGKGDAMTAADVPTAALKQFYAGVTLTSGSSGDLAKRFTADPTAADAMINYESVIDTLPSPLVKIVPTEGVITADYPLILLKKSPRADQYNQLVAYLRDPAVQQQIATLTKRQPLSNSATTVVNELPFPATSDVIDALLQQFQDGISRPVATFFVLDISGSMSGERLNNLKQAMHTLVAGDNTLSGRFSTLRPRETVGITFFSTNAHQTKLFDLKDTREASKPILADIDQLVQSAAVEDGTAIYSGLLEALTSAQASAKAGKRTAIVLMTDGANNAGPSLVDFIQQIQQPPLNGYKIPVYGILFGEASSTDMDKLASATGGAVFDARKTPLRTVFKTIRNYQ